jgi:hypothetical protein
MLRKVRLFLPRRLSLRRPPVSFPGSRVALLARPAGSEGSAKDKERIPSLGAAEHQEHHEELALVGRDIRRAVSSTIALNEANLIVAARLGREAGGAGLCKGGRDGRKENGINCHPP